jgi:hypothetical protein
VLQKDTEYRGCMKDLMNLLKLTLIDGRNIDELSGSSNDQCKTIEAPGSSTSLCKCTTNLCNSSTKNSYFSFPVLIFIFFVVYQFPCVFLL